MKFKFLLSCILALTLSVHSIAVAQTPPAGYEDDIRTRSTYNWFSDVDPNSRVGIAANYLADAGIIGGFPDGTFRENQLVTRGGMAKFVTNADVTCEVQDFKNNARFRDLLSGQWYVKYIIAAANCGIMFGEANGTVSPQRSVNTVEFLAMISRAEGLGLKTSLTHSYSDVSTLDWYNKYAGIAEHYNLFPGRGSRLRPGQSLTRGEVAYAMYKVLIRNDQVQTDPDPQPNPDLKNVDVAISSVDFSSTSQTIAFKQVITNKKRHKGKNIRLSTNIPNGLTFLYSTGAQCSLSSNTVRCSNVAIDRPVVITFKKSSSTCKAYEYTAAITTTSYDVNISNNSTTIHSNCSQPDTNLTISKSVTTAKADTIPKGSSRVKMLSVDLKSSCNSKNIVDAFTVIHEGFGNSQNVSGVYAMQNNERVSRIRTFDGANNEVVIRFTEPLVIEACNKQTIDIVADYKKNIATSSEHTFTIELASDVLNNSKNVSGTFPIRGNSFRIAAVNTGEVFASHNLIQNKSARVGDTKVLLGSYRLAADGIENQTVYHITLEQQGSAAAGDLRNVSIYTKDGLKLTNTISRVTNELTTFTFDPPFTLQEYNSINLELRGDVTDGANTTRTAQFAITEESDVNVIGSLYGYGMNGQMYGSSVTVSGTPTAIQYSKSGQSNTNNAELTLSLSGSSTEYYSVGERDAALTRVHFDTNGEKIDVQTMYVLVEARDKNARKLRSLQLKNVLDDVELRNTLNGRTIDAEVTSGYGAFGSTGNYTWQIFTLEDFIVQDDEVWDFKVDFAGDEGLMYGDNFTVRICTQSALKVNGVPVSDGCDFGLLSFSSTRYEIEAERLNDGAHVRVLPRNYITGKKQTLVEKSPQMYVGVENTVASDSATVGQQDITLLDFTTYASDHEDLLLSKVEFKVQSGDANDVQNYALLVDTTGDNLVDTILEDNRASQNGVISFDDLPVGGLIIPKGTSNLFRVIGDVSNNLSGELYELGFYTTDNGYIEAEQLVDGLNLDGIKTNGNCNSATCAIEVDTQPSTVWSFTN